jgi:hypothetical protein
LPYFVAGQSATIRFGRGRRPRGPTYARGTIRSLFENQELADNARHMTSRRAHPAVTFFGTLISRSFSLFVSSIRTIFSLSGQGSFFVHRFTFSFLSVSLSVSLSVFVCFFRGFFRVFIVESLCQPVLGRLESHMLAPKF